MKRYISVNNIICRLLKVHLFSKQIKIMRKHLKTISILCFFIFQSTFSYSQIDANYSVGTWYGFKQAAVSYTFDDLTSNQLPVALPLFNQYGFKMTFNVVTNWGPNWSALLVASGDGHEIASHTVSHATLDAISIANQITELQNSQNIINTNITNSKCVTVAYPNCNVGDKNTISQYYIAGRICSNQIVPSSPPDMYNISSIICGNQGMATNAQGLTNNVNSAKNSNGWCVFLFHGIDNDGGYSPFSSTELNTHLQYMNTNYSDYWIGTFANVSKYIQERNNVSISENNITSDSIEVTISDNLDNSIYNANLSIRREIPASWEGANVYANNTKINSQEISSNGKTYVEFEAIPDSETIHIANTAQKIVTKTLVLKKGWNLISYPYTLNRSVETVFESIWDYVEVIKNEDSYFLKSNTPELNLLQEMKWGKGYFIKVSQACTINWNY